jgi:hypothetical protein
LLPIDWQIVQILRQRHRKITNTAPTTLVQYKQQANPLLSMNIYTPLVISGNDKNNQLTLLSQCKLALTSIITINVPVVFLWRGTCAVLRGATSLRGALEGVGPENQDFFGP